MSEDASRLSLKMPTAGPAIIHYSLFNIHYSLNKIASGLSVITTLRFHIILFLGQNLFLTAHIRTQCDGDIDTAVFVEVIFKECDKHSGGSNNCVV